MWCELAKTSLTTKLAPLNDGRGFALLLSAPRWQHQIAHRQLNTYPKFQVQRARIAGARAWQPLFSTPSGPRVHGTAFRSLPALAEVSGAWKTCSVSQSRMRGAALSFLVAQYSPAHFPFFFPFPFPEGQKTAGGCLWNL